MSQEQGLRYNKGKLRYDLLHPVAQEGIVKVLTFGANKYKDRNWEKGLSWTSTLASMKRHIAAIEKGEDFDPESGLKHIDHVQCNAHFLSAYYKIAPQFDDRPHSYLNPPKIGLDIDEVICDWLGGWCEKFKIDRPTAWYFHRDIVKEFDTLEEDGTLEEFMMNLKPLIDPQDIPFEPHCYITSRRIKQEITEKWIDQNGFPTKPVYSIPANSSKIEIAKASGVDIFVDDRYENFVELNNAGICTFLFDAPHNRRYDVGYKRITSLKELI